MKREIPKKNYIIVSVIALIVAILVLYLAKLYTNININKNNSIMSNYLFNVTTKELDNYLLENPNIIVYWSDSEDVSNNNFEKKLKKYIIRNDLQKNFVFVNTNGITSEESDAIADKYLTNELKSKNINLEIVPNLLIIEEGKIIDVLYTYEQDMSMEYLKEEFKGHGVIE